MTTIATDGRWIGADGRTTGGVEIFTETHSKLMELPDGSVVGGAGDRAVAARARAELHIALVKGREPQDVEGDYLLLRLFPSGALALYDGGILSHPQWLDPPFAIGSGAEFARGALAAGASVRKALAIAHRFDSGTGPLNQIFKVARP